MNNYLASYPRSGSTYLRFLLDLNSSYNIDTTHQNKFDKDLTTDKTDKKTTTICLKTHYPSSFQKSAVYGINPLENKNSKIVVLTRNPYDTLMSFKNLAGLESVSDKEVEVFCDDWTKFINFYKSSPNQNTLFVTYENLVENPASVCESLLSFFGHPIEWKFENFQNVTREMSIERTKNLTSDLGQSKNFIGSCSPPFSKKKFYSKKQLEIFSSKCSGYFKEE